MNIVNTEVKIDLYKSSLEIIKAQQGDHLSRTITFSLYNNGETYTIADGVDVTLEGCRPSGTSFNQECRVYDNKVIVTLDSNILGHSGTAKAKIVLYDKIEGSILSSIPFKIEIGECPADKNNPTVEEMTIIDKLTLELSDTITNAKSIEENAKNYAERAELAEGNAQSYMNSAKTSAMNASTSATSASTSATSATNSASAAKTSETNAKASETNASSSASKAKTSETNASNSASSASSSATTATTQANNAKTYADLSESYAIGGTSTRTGEDTDNAKYYKEQASTSASSAKSSETNAKTYSTNASTSATNAKTSETNAKTSETNASSSATSAQNYAVGSTDSAKYYYLQAKAISESFSGALRPMGTVTFANLPSASSATEGDMYNVSDQFTTTTSFKEGSGNVIPAGSNVYKTSDGYWDVLAGSPVTGVKGNSETSYRRGNVNITKANIGLGNVDNTSDANKPISTATQTALDGKANSLHGNHVPTTETANNAKFLRNDNTWATVTPANIGALATNGDSKSNTVTFTSNDVADASATSWTSVTALASGITHATFFQRVSQMFKNVRYIYKMLGTTDISAIGNGTVTNAISTLNSNLEWKKIGSVNGRTTLNLPSQYKEIIVKGETIDGVCVTMHFCKSQLTSEIKNYRGGWYNNANYYAEFILLISLSMLQLNSFWIDGGNHEETTTLTAFYR